MWFFTRLSPASSYRDIQAFHTRVMQAAHSGRLLISRVDRDTATAHTTIHGDRGSRGGGDTSSLQTSLDRSSGPRTSRKGGVVTL